MKNIMILLCCYMFTPIFLGCQISTPTTGTSVNNKDPLQLEIILPKDIYIIDLLTKATVKSGDAMRGQKFEEELKKLIITPDQAEHYLTATQPIICIIRNISMQKVFFFRRLNEITIRLEDPEGGRNIVCTKPHSKIYGSTSWSPKYLEEYCITVLEPGEFITDVIMPSEYEHFPTPKNMLQAKEWRLSLEVKVAEVPYHQKKITGIEIFKGMLVSNTVTAMILPSLQMESPLK